MTVAKWVFQQLSGERRRIELEGWDAPFGRPRQGAVVEDGVALRHNPVYYDGNPEPTVHIFGDKNEDIELNGRFRDRYGGRNSAQALAEQFKAFTRDGQLAHITWGDTISLRAFITSFTPGRESRGEIEWRMSLLVVSDDLAERRPDPPLRQLPADHTDAIMAAMRKVWAASPDAPSADAPDRPETPKPPTKLPTSVLDIIAGFTDMLGSFTASLANIAGQIESFERAAIGEVRRFRAAIRQIRTAALRLMRTYDSLEMHWLEVQDAEDELRLEEMRTESQEALAEMLAEVDVAAEAARRAELGQIQAVYVAVTGDTWESIARKFYGDPQQAASIRDANGVSSGVEPIEGEMYAIPRKAA